MEISKTNSEPKIFIMRKCILLLMLVFLYSIIQAQQTKVIGKVMNQNGIAIANTSILVKGTTNGTTTNEQGSFTLNATLGDVLEVSNLNYATKEVIVTSDAINITLVEKDSQMSEVVVVGYGTQRKSSLTGSVAQLSGERLTEVPAMNISNMLAGRLPGVTTLQQSGRPGFDDALLRIRGDKNPLVIVDGVPRDFANLDPNEIETISVLKDASSAAAYGVLGGNGVLLITTKKGAAKKPVIAYSGQYTTNEFTRFPKFLNGPDYMKWYRRGEEMDNEYITHNGGTPVKYTYTDIEYQQLADGTNTNPFFGNTDWLGKLLGNRSPAQHHNLSVNGGSENTKYFISLGYLNQKGVVKNNDFKRYNIRTNIETGIGKNFTIGLNLGARREDRNTSGIPADNESWMNPFYQAVRMLPNLPETTPDGIPVGYQAGAGVVNPIASIDKAGFQKMQSSVLNSTLNLRYKIPYLKGLELKLLTGYDKTTQQSKAWSEPYQLMLRTLGTNGWTWVPTLPAGITTTSLRESVYDFTRQAFQPSIVYENKFNKHGIKALALYEYIQQNNKLLSGGSRNFVLTDIKDIDFGSVAKEDISVGGNSSETRRGGYLGRINYDFDGRYLLELVARYDGSMNFIGSKKRWGFFPAASAGWVISKEDWFSKNESNPVSFLKLRASIGKLGEDRVSVTFPYLNTFSLTSNPVVIIGGKEYPALFTGAIANPDLTWETSTMKNIGLDATLWKGLLGIEFDWFYKVQRDILNSVAGIYPPSVGGYYNGLQNFGVVDYRGFDLRLTHHNNIGKLYYDVAANINWMRNRVIKWTEAANTPAAQRIVGKSRGTKFGLVADGLFQSWDEVNSWAASPSGSAAPGFIRYHDLNGDGKITTDDYAVIGKSNIPELMYGLDLKFKYSIIDVSLLLQGAAISNIALAGNYEGSAGVSNTSDNTPFTRSFYNYGNSPYYLVEDSWTPENPNAAFPRLSSYRAPMPNHNGWANSLYIRDGGYLRLKSMQVGATINPKVLEKIGFNSARIYVGGFNLFTWDKVKYLDPEMPNVNNGFYPQQKMYTAGINLSF